LCRSGCERSEFPDISFFNKTHEIDIEFHEVSYEVARRGHPGVES
jgi:hypothetical protein